MLDMRTRHRLIRNAMIAGALCKPGPQTAAPGRVYIVKPKCIGTGGPNWVGLPTELFARGRGHAAAARHTSRWDHAKERPYDRPTSRIASAPRPTRVGSFHTGFPTARRESTPRWKPGDGPRKEGHGSPRRIKATKNRNVDVGLWMGLPARRRPARACGRRRSRMADMIDREARPNRWTEPNTAWVPYPPPQT